MDTTFWTEVSRFGAGIFIAIVVLVMYDRLSNKLASVIEANTRAMTEVQQTMEASCAALSAHETHTVASRQSITRIEATTDRIEGKVDKILDRGTAPPTRKTGGQ